MRFTSKLPDVGTHHLHRDVAVAPSKRTRSNIGQGFPDYPIDPRLGQALLEVVAEGRNQYAPMEGAIELRDEIAKKLLVNHGRRFDPAHEITITCGATEGLYDAIQAVVGPGDEAIILRSGVRRL